MSNRYEPTSECYVCPRERPRRRGVRGLPNQALPLPRSAVRLGDGALKIARLAWVGLVVWAASVAGAALFIAPGKAETLVNITETTSGNKDIGIVVSWSIKLNKMELVYKSDRLFKNGFETPR